ncbi:MAG: hypothetical protein PHY02_02785 [Phycisphaerae bacterium]|nr:hypothetical protein [Phycisphaerae bacterium]
MSPEPPNSISVIDPIGPAIERAKVMLFRPFDLGKWFTIGFCAWLAYLTGGGGGGGFQWHEPYKSSGRDAKVTEAIGSAKAYLLGNLGWIIPVAAVIILLLIAIGLVILWLNSRGKFMFLHCVAGNKSEVSVPWHKFRKHGNSLFLFRIVLSIIGLAVTAVPIVGIVFFAIMMASKAVTYIAAIPGIILCGLIVFVIAVALALVRKFTFDFVVPIMFLRTESCMAGWREFRTILSANKARLALYILFQIVIAMAIGTIVFLGICIGCCFCCVSALLFVPYVGTVILLPIFVFRQSYTIYYLRQFGPRFDVFGS